MIKSAKRAIYTVLKNEKITDEELQTVFVRVEGFMNSRPLTVQSDDTKEEDPLTPNHFLQGRWKETNIEELTVGGRKSLLIRWRQVQQWTTHIWHRWLTELVPMWAGREKWRTDTENLKSGTVVWLIEKEARPGDWKIGRIEKVCPGGDGKVRVVELRSKGKLLVRPVSRIFPLEFDNRRGAESTRGNVQSGSQA